MNLFRRFLYFPEKLRAEAPVPPHALGAVELFLKTSDGETVHALWWPPPEGRPVLLFFHGNAGHVFDWALVRKELAPMDVGLLLLDYRGYGKSTGSPSEEGLYADAEAAMAWLAAAGHGAGQVVLMGKSLGGGVATEMARRHPVRGLVLESTFTSIPAVAKHLFPMLPVGGLIPDRFLSVGKLPEITCPVFVIHGERDSLIPVSEGRVLHDAAGPRKALWLVRAADHNDVSWVAGEEYGRRLRAWLDGVHAHDHDHDHAPPPRR